MKNDDTVVYGTVDYIHEAADKRHRPSVDYDVMDVMDVMAGTYVYSSQLTTIDYLGYCRSSGI